MLTQTLPLRHVSEFAADVREGLTKSGQRELPSKYLYDEVGSALFETICVLPEYGLTRADARLLKEHAREIVGLLPSPVQVAELG
ncbi:MAG: L-histidine N(alpha)-methyltransferase, partial [Candidatus Acidiferrum sp.]